MKSIVIGGIIFITALIAGTYFLAGSKDAFKLGEDYINDLTMLAALAIMTITFFVVLKYLNQIKNDKASGELESGSWDGIREFKNNIPFGWGLAFIGTIIWGMIYWVYIYPTNSFSQIGQWNEETINYNKKFESKWKNPSSEDLNAMGQSLFFVQCAPCHGIDAEGIDGKAQDLTKRMNTDSIYYVIKKGSAGIGANPAGNLGYGFGIMPDQSGIINIDTGLPITDDEAKIVSSYIVNGMKGNGAGIYAASCASCHGADGKGMDGLSPNLIAYDDTLVKNVLLYGKKGNIGAMPSFAGRLNETQVIALASYIRSLGE